jgi:hypothetical protein
MTKLFKGKAGTRGVPDGSGPEGKGPTGRRQGDCPKKEDYDSTFEWRKAYFKWKKKNGGEDEVEKSKSDVVVLQPSEIRRLQKSRIREKILFVKEQ